MYISYIEESKVTPSHYRSATSIYSSKEKNREMAFEIVKAQSRIIKKEQLRPKILIPDTPHEKVKNPSVYISQARQKFLHKQNSITLTAMPQPGIALLSRKSSNLMRKTFQSLNFAESAKNKKSSLEDSSEVLPDWLIERPDFQEVVKNFGKSHASIASICAEHPSARSPEKKKALFEWISGLQFFSKIPARVTKDVCEKLTRNDYAVGEVVIRKGDKGDCIIIIYSGKVNIYLEPEVLHCTVGEKNVIGEQALDNSKPRNATVVAIEPLIAFKLMKFDYDTILLNIKKQEKSENLAFLANISFFKHWSYLKVQNLSYYILQKTYNSEEIIFDIGHPSDTFFIIRSGQVEIQAMVTLNRNNIWPIGGKEWKIREVSRKYIVTIAKLGPGDYFGESCILNRCDRVTRAVCMKNALCLTVNIDEFFEIFSSKDIDDMQYNARLIIPTEQELKSKLIEEIKSKAVNVRII